MIHGFWKIIPSHGFMADWYHAWATASRLLAEMEVIKNAENPRFKHGLEHGIWVFPSFSFRQILIHISIPVWISGEALLWTNSVGYKNYSQARGYRMEVHEPHFFSTLPRLQNANSFQQPWHRRKFPLLQNATSFSTTVHTRTCPFATKCSFRFQELHMQRTAIDTKWVKMPRFNKTILYKLCPYKMPSCFWKTLKNPSSRHTRSLQNASAVFQIQDLDHIMLLQNVRLILISPSEAHQIFLQNATAILMIA